MRYNKSKMSKEMETGLDDFLTHQQGDEVTFPSCVAKDPELVKLEPF
jgi:hypothetical protein